MILDVETWKDYLRKDTWDKGKNRDPHVRNEMLMWTSRDGTWHVGDRSPPDCLLQATGPGNPCVNTTTTTTVCGNWAQEWSSWSTCLLFLILRFSLRLWPGICCGQASPAWATSPVKKVGARALKAILFNRSIKSYLWENQIFDGPPSPSFAALLF